MVRDDAPSMTSSSAGDIGTLWKGRSNSVRGNEGSSIGKSSPYYCRRDVEREQDPQQKLEERIYLELWKRTAGQHPEETAPNFRLHGLQ